MSKYIEPTMGCWVVKCDWVDPTTGEACILGREGEPAMFIDPDGGRNPDRHFQCGRHHGIIPQAERPEFQLPKGHKLNTSELRSEAEEVTVEEVNEDE